MRNVFALFGFILLVAAISALSSYITMPAVAGWYQTLNKAPWNPPDYVFGPVWTTLYIMIAISGWLVWRKLPAASIRSRMTHPSMRYYWLQLMCNFAWSMLFFGLHNALLAAVDIVLMMIAITLNIYAFRKQDRLAAWLLVPYLLWVLYAATLNVAIIVLN